MKPMYAKLKSNHYSSSFARGERVSEVDLYNEMGIDFAKLKKSNPAYENTCAARMSLALLKSGVSVPGRMKIQSGPFAGRFIEPGAKLLADKLMSPTALGKPEIYSGKEASAKIKNRKGLVFFRRIGGGNVDHIDLIESINAEQVCHSNCYFQTTEVWFWELP